MAELGNLFNLNGSTTESVDTDVDMLDYTYISNCDDVHKLNSIITTLKSGKEGYYPDLLQFAEDKFLKMLSVKDRKRYLAMYSGASNEEIQTATADLCSWELRMAAKQPVLKAATNSTVFRSEPPVRGTKTASVGVKEKLEMSDVYPHLNKNQNFKLHELRTKLNTASLASVLRESRAEMERVKGNESFRTGDNEDAVACYSRSIAYNDLVAAVWANRAMAYIRLELFDLAEQDCSTALELDSKYLKALSRRGLVRFKRGMYALAVSDFRAALLLDPDSAELSKLLRNALDKYREVEGVDCQPERPAGEILVRVVSAFSDLDLPDNLCEMVVLSSGQLVPQENKPEAISEAGSDNACAQTGFVRIAVAVDSDSDEESEDAGESVALRRIAVVEGSDSEEDEQEEHQAALVAAEALKEEGNQLLQKGLVADAIRKYGESLCHNPDFVPALGNRAQAFLVTCDYTSAVQDCSSVLALEPSNCKALYRRALARHALGEIGLATQDIRTLALDASNAGQVAKLCEKLHIDASGLGDSNFPFSDECALRALKTRSQVLIGSGDASSVVQLLRSLPEETVPPSASADVSALLHSLAAAYVALGQFAEAMRSCDAILRLDSANFKALVRRGECCLLLAAQETRAESKESLLLLAKRDISAVLAVDAKHKEASRLLEELQLAFQGSEAEERAHKRFTSDQLKERGNDAVSRSDFVAASDLYSAAIAADDSNVSAFNNRALSLLKLGKFQEAVSDCGVVLLRLASATPGPTESAAVVKALLRRSEAHRGLAKTQSRSADDAQRSLEAALRDVEEVLRLDSGNESAASRKAAILKSLAETKRSASELALGHQSTKQRKSEPSELGGAPSNSSTGGDLLLIERSSKRIVVPKEHTQVSHLSDSTHTTPEKKIISGKAGEHSVSSKTKTSQDRSPLVETAVPTEPPKTVYELERVWRALKGRPAAFAQYLMIFKKSTYRRVIREALSPEIISAILVALRDHTPSRQSQLRALQGLSSCPNFSFTVSLLTTSDQHSVRQVISQIEDALAVDKELKITTKELKELKDVFCLV